MKVILCHNYYKLPGGEDQVFDDECWLLEQHGHSVTRFKKHNRDIETMSKWSMIRSTISNSKARADLASWWIRLDQMLFIFRTRFH